MSRRTGGLLASALIVLVLALLPAVLPGTFYLTVARHVIVFALLALSLNILIGYGGMTSLGHAVYLGVPAYAYAWLTANAGFGPLPAAVAAVLLGTGLAGLFGVLSLRASGLGFLMITLALGQIAWGLSYRWVGLTGGDNGMNAARPVLLGLDLSPPLTFYYFLAAVFAVALFCLWQLSASPFAACLRGARDQPRRMRMLGHNVWLIRFSAFVLAGFWGSVAGVLYVWDYAFISPQTMSLQQSAEALLMVVLGGAGTLAGPVVGAAVITLVKTVVSSYVDRWSSLLGLIFIVVVMVLPQGIVPGLQALRRGTGMIPALEITGLKKRFGGVSATRDVSLCVMPGERRLLIGPNGAGKTTLFNLITGDLRADAGSVKLFGQELLGLPTRRRVALGLGRTYQILTLFPQETLAHNVALALIGSTGSGWRPWGAFAHRHDLHDAARRALDQVGLGGLSDCIVAQTAYGERRRLELAMALAQKPKLLLLDEPLAGLSATERDTVAGLLDTLPADIAIVLIEHDMDMALAFAQRITLLNYGAVVLEGTRAEVIADPRTREVYLGE